MKNDEGRGRPRTRWLGIRATRAVILPTSALLIAACSSPSPSAQHDSVESTSAELTQCSAHGIAISDLHADFRDIWAGRETTATGKQADPNLQATVDFNTTVDPTLLAAQFLPAAASGTSCGSAIAATQNGSLSAPNVWGNTASNSARPQQPEPYNLIVRESISGVVSAGGPIAAGGNISLTSFGVNGTAREPIGMIAGGQVTIANGSLQGNLTFGSPSTIPSSASISGTRTQLPFDVGAAFDNLRGLSALLAEEAPTGSTQSNNGTLLLSGTKAGLNVFAVDASALQGASTLQISVPTAAGVLINVTGTSVTLQNKGVTLQGVASASLLWNLPATSFLHIASIGLFGSLLAPDARVSFDSGSISGTVVARSFQGTASGSLSPAPLNVALLFPAGSTPSAVRLSPAQPLLRGCTYQFVIPANQPLAGSNCLAAGLNVAFNVAAHPSTAAGRELASAATDPKNQTLRRFEARPGINTPLNDVWARYASAIGIARSDLVVNGAARPSSTRTGQQLTYYQQYYQGYPVADFGYLVATEAGIFRNADGKVAPSLPATLPAPMSAAQALQSAVQLLKLGTPPWVSKPAQFSPPVATLELLSKRPDPATADFVLVWDLDFKASGVLGLAKLVLDASTAQLLLQTGTAQQVTQLDPAAVYQSQISNTVDAPNGTGPQSISAAQFKLPNGQLVTTPSSAFNSVEPLGVGLFQPPATGGTAPPPQFIIDPTPSTPWTSTEPVEQEIAYGYGGLGRALAYLQTLNFRLIPGGSPWTFIDGTGQRSLVFVWNPPGGRLPNNADFEPDFNPNWATIQAFDSPTGTPNGLHVVPHEFGHGWLYYLRSAQGLPAFNYLGETGAMMEGTADAFSVGSAHLQFPASPDDVLCFQLDGTNCSRDTSTPLLTFNPELYLGQNYQSFTDTTACQNTDHCFVHLNSTIISHWVYLAAFGSTSPNPCGLKLAPLDPNPDVAMKMALNIAYLAAGTRISGAAPSFFDLRDQTLSVTRDLIAQGLLPEDALRKVELAWYAVGVFPTFLSAPDPSVQPSDLSEPADDGVSVYPWQTFEWSLSNPQTASAWDFQISGDAAFDTNILYQSTTPISTTTTENGVTRASFALALPFDSTTRYYWRVRPHTTDAWLSCYPIHSFTSTTEPDTIASMSPTLRPGANGLTWTDVRGAVQYKVFVSTTDSNCTSGSDVIQSTSTTPGALVNGLQPETHYFVEVLPIGPNGFDGNPSVGACFKQEFDTPPLRAPVAGPPADTAIFSYSPGIQVTWGWLAFDQPDHYRIQLYAIDTLGNCGAALATTLTAPDACNWSTGDPALIDQCVETSAFSQDTSLLRNPTGYCWNVVAVAKNGKESPPSQTLKFYYALDPVIKLSPGKRPPNLSFSQPNSLGKSSYGLNVPFSWNALPNALDYVVEVGRWPMSVFTARRDPLNCVEVGQNVLVRPPFTSCSLDGTGCTQYTPTPDNLGPMSGCDIASAVDGTFSLVTRVADTSASLDGNSVGKGRYCWLISPELADPQVSGHVSAGQPLVEKDLQYCYTTGPSTPWFEFDNLPAPPPAPFSSTPITGRAHFDYVPDSQAEIQGSSSDISFNFDNCKVQPGAILYQDFYDCVVGITINPQPNQGYTVVASTWASDDFPAIKNDSTKLPDVNAIFQTGGCGRIGESCCDTGEACTEPGSSCNAGVCTGCGRKGEACCAPAANNDNQQCLGQFKMAPATFESGSVPYLNLGCMNGVCADCGSSGQVCCPAVDNQTGTPTGFLMCPGTAVTDKNGEVTMFHCADSHSDTCESCGHLGEPCCTEGGGSQGCGGSLICANDNKCAEPPPPPPPPPPPGTGGGGSGGGGGGCNASFAYSSFAEISPDTPPLQGPNDFPVSLPSFSGLVSLSVQASGLSADVTNAEVSLIEGAVGQDETLWSEQLLPPDEHVNSGPIQLNGTAPVTLEFILDCDPLSAGCTGSLGVEVTCP